MGLSAEGLREQIKDEGLLSVLKTLAERFDGNEAAAASVFGNIRALSGVMDLMGANVATTEQIFANMTDTTGALDKAFEATTETAAFKLQQAMANLQQALIDIGNVLIPIVVPILTTLSDIVKALATGFGALPDPIKKVAGAMTVLAAATGPALLGVGKLASKEGQGALGGLLSVVKKHPKAFVAMGVAVGATALIMRGFRKRAQEAKERMETLQQELRDSGDPTVTLTDDFKALAEAIGKVTEEAEGSVPDIKSFAGETTLTADLLKKGLVKEFEALGLNMEDLMPLLATGTDKFHEFGDATKAAVQRGDVDGFVKALRGADSEISAYTNALADAIEAEEITIEQARKMHISLDDTADAFDDARNATKKSVKEFLEGEEALGFFTKAFGELGGSMLETTKEAEDQVRALQDMHTMMAQSQEMDMLNSNLEDIDFGLGEVEEATRSVEKGFVFLREDLGLTADEIKEIRNQFDELMGQFDDIVSDSFDLDLALLKVKDMFVELGEAIVGLNDEEKTQLERQIDLIQASKNLADSVVDTIEAFDDLADPAVTTFLNDMIGELDTLKGTMPDEEFQRLVDVLFNLQNQVDTLNNLELMIDAGINFSGVPPELMQLMAGATPTPELLSATTGLFGSMAGFAGFAEGGLVKGPMLGLVGEAGPELIVPLDRLGSMGGTTNVTINMPVGVSGEDVVRELERYTRQEGNLQLPVSSTVRR